MALKIVLSDAYWMLCLRLGDYDPSRALSIYERCTHADIASAATVRSHDDHLRAEQAKKKR